MYTLVIQLIKANFQREESSARGIYLDLYEAIRKLAERGDLPSETPLPPTRLLSEKLSLSRSTVVKAYGLLAENQILVSKHGSGFWVKSPARESPKKLLAPSHYPEISELGQSFLRSLHILNNVSDESLAFTPGLPPVDIFPIQQWQKLSNLYWRNIKSSDLNYSISSGIGSLKASIADYLLLSRRIRCQPEQIVVVSGSLQSLYLLGTVLLNKGDTVWMEDPTFPNVISIFKSLQARISTLSTGPEGWIFPSASADGQKAKLIHVTPSNQYPLGGKMSLTQRQQLLARASEDGSLIIENDYEHEINNWQSPTESIFSLDPEQRTIFLGTFNRIMHPSIRLGYMVLPPHLLPAIQALQIHSHRFVPQSIQVVMTEFIHQNLIYKHIRMAIEEAAERKSYFISQFEKHVPPGLSILPTPVSSFHLLARPKAGISDLSLVNALEAKGIHAHALSKCYVGEVQQQGLILGYSCVNKSSMNQLIPRLAEAINPLFPG